MEVGSAAIEAALAAAAAATAAAQARARVADLVARDREVRAHERAHLTAGRPWVSAPVYAFERGPDGRAYAVAGSVAFDAAPVRGDPAATVEKMRVVVRAALAPEDPDARDRRVAAAARAEMVRALAALEPAESGPPRRF